MCVCEGWWVVDRMEVLGSIGCIPMHPSFASSFTSPSSIASIFGLLYYRTVGKVCVCGCPGGHCHTGFRMPDRFKAIFL